MALEIGCQQAGLSMRPRNTYDAPMTRYTLIAVLAFATACGGDDGKSTTDGNTATDGTMNTIDSHPATPTTHLPGTATKREASGSTPLEGVTIGAFANTD